MRHIRLLLAAFAAIFALCGGEIQAFAQAANCQQLTNSLRSLTSNSDYAQLQRNSIRARQAADSVQAAESQFVRDGCQNLLNSRQRLTASCRGLARAILQGRSDYDKLVAKVDTGQAVAQQRETVLQQIARFGCGTGSSATITQQDRPDNRSPFEILLDNLFNGGQRVVNEPYDFYGQSTLRTVCVRSCDGYYWPVSFSTLPDYLQQDEAICAQQCPGADVSLYYYQNPDGTPQDMVDLSGQPYSSTPNAFRYRREVDASCTCKPAISYGSIAVNVSAAGGQSRPMISFNDLNFPLPLRDPRRQAGTVTMAQVEVAPQVPLPRPRPVRDGEDGPATGRPQLVTANERALRIIQSGQRLVRIVGPDTPYVQAAEAGT